MGRYRKGSNPEDPDSKLGTGKRKRHREVPGERPGMDGDSQREPVPQGTHPCGMDGKIIREMLVEQDADKYFTIVGVAERGAFWMVLWKFPALEAGVAQVIGFN
jgi:hypothetical protein